MFHRPHLTEVLFLEILLAYISEKGMQYCKGIEEKVATYANFAVEKVRLRHHREYKQLPRDRFRKLS